MEQCLLKRAHGFCTWGYNTTPVRSHTCRYFGLPMWRIPHVCVHVFFCFFLCECSPFLFILRHKLVSFTGALRNAKVADNLLKIYIAPFFFVGRYLIYHYIFNFDMRLQAEFGASCLSIPLCPLVLELSCLNNLYHVGFWIPG